MMHIQIISLECAYKTYGRTSQTLGCTSITLVIVLQCGMNCREIYGNPPSLLIWSLLYQNSLAAIDDIDAFFER